MMTGLLAHQGGWDELLMFLLPIGLVVATWFVLERRRGRSRGEPDNSDTPASGTAETEPRTDA